MFGLHSLLDWIWFVPGPTVAALVAAGFVAGRGPLGWRARAGGGGCQPAETAGGRARRGRRDAARPAVAAAAVLVTALLCAWAVWQPERAHRATDNALAALDRGDLDEAADEAERARDIDPYSPEPLWAQAEVLAEQRRLRRAYRTFEQAVIEHPHDPEPWLRLGRFELDEVGMPARAVDTATVAMEVDPRSRQAVELRDRAQAALSRVGAPLSGEPAPAACRSSPQGEHLEAHLIQQAPQRATGEEAQVGRERIEARSKPRVSTASPSAAHAPAWSPPAALRAQHAARLREQELDVAHVLEGLGAEHEVERVVLERQRRVGLELDRPRRGRRRRARASATADTSASVRASAFDLLRSAGRRRNRGPVRARPARARGRTARGAPAARPASGTRAQSSSS